MSSESSLDEAYLAAKMCLIRLLQLVEAVAARNCPLPPAKPMMAKFREIVPRFQKELARLKEYEPATRNIRPPGRAVVTSCGESDLLARSVVLLIAEKVESWYSVCQEAYGDDDAIEHFSEVFCNSWTWSKSELERLWAEAGAEYLDTARDSDFFTVTLLQAAAVVSKGKRTLERWQQKDPKFPLPDVEGGGGLSNEWKWSRLRPYLEKRTGKTLPQRFPSDSLRPDLGALES